MMARRVGGGYKLNRSVVWSSSSAGAHPLVVALLIEALSMSQLSGQVPVASRPFRLNSPTIYATTQERFLNNEAVV